MAKERGGKKKIGISFAGHDLKVGPVIGAMVVVDPAVWRRFTFLDIQWADKLKRTEVNKAVEIIQKNIDFKINRITPAHMLKEPLPALEFQNVIQLLNSRIKFWKDKININIADPDMDRDEYVEGILEHRPHNLKSVKLDIEKWNVAHHVPRRSAQLADCFAHYYLNIALNDIKGVWGDFGSGLESDPKTQEWLADNNDCPHIRREPDGSIIKETEGV